MGTKDWSDAKNKDIHYAVGDQKGNDMIEIKFVHARDTYGQERVDRT